jgi:hypothetical protein
MLCAACMFHAHLPYLTLNYNLECEEPSYIIYFWANFLLSQTVGPSFFQGLPTANFLQLASSSTISIPV